METNVPSDSQEKWTETLFRWFLQRKIRAAMGLTHNYMLKLMEMAIGPNFYYRSREVKGV